MIFSQRKPNEASSNMNHPHPMTDQNYWGKAVAGTIMQDACNEFRGESPVIDDTAVTNDGIW